MPTGLRVSLPPFDFMALLVVTWTLRWPWPFRAGAAEDWGWDVGIESTTLELRVAEKASYQSEAENKRRR